MYFLDGLDKGNYKSSSLMIKQVVHFNQ